MKKLFIILILISMASGNLLLGGCGDNESEAGSENASEFAPQTTLLPKERYVARADAICRDTIKRRSAAFKSYLKRTGLTVESIDVLERADPLGKLYVGVYRKQEDRLRNLGVPQGDEEEVGEILAEMQRILDEIEERPEDFVLNPNPFGPVSDKARDYGFKICAEAYFEPRAQ